MRTPTTSDQVWLWWQSALDGNPLPVREEEPQSGFFKIRRFRYGQFPKGPWVPARIWLEPGEVDPETGELLSDEQYRAEIDGRPADPWRAWTWISRHPVSMEEWEWLRAMSPLAPKKIPA